MNEFSAENTIERMMIQKAFAMQRPLNGTLELLPLCNMSCSMCYVHLSRNEMEQRGRLRSASEWLELGRQMQKAGVLFLLLTGGEPLLFPGFREVYTGLRQMGIFLTLNTNGTLIDDDWVSFFAENPPRRINITLYGSSEETYASLCRYPGGFARTMRAIRSLKNAGVAVKINASAVKENAAEIVAIYDIGRELDIPVAVDTYMIPGLHERDLPIENQSRLLPEDAARMHWNVLRHDMSAAELQSHVHRMLEAVEHHDPRQHQYPDAVNCLASNCSFAVDWKGNMRPCVTLEEPAVPVFDLGFEEAWKQISVDTKQFRLNEKCTACRLRPLCPNCVGSAWLETGRYDGVPEYLCRYSEVLYRIMKENAADDRSSILP